MSASQIFSEKLSKLARQAGVDASMREQYKDNVENAIKHLNDALPCGDLFEAKAQIELALYYLKFMIDIDRSFKQEENTNETL